MIGLETPQAAPIEWPVGTVRRLEGLAGGVVVLLGEWVLSNYRDVVNKVFGWKCCAVVKGFEDDISACGVDYQTLSGRILVAWLGLGD